MIGVGGVTSSHDHHGVCLPCDLDDLTLPGPGVLADGVEELDVRRLPVPLADLAGGTFAALRILAWLVCASKGGDGAVVDVSLAGSLRDWVDSIGGADAPTAVLPHLPHYSVFETADGHRLSIGNVYEDHFWRDFCRVLELEVDPELDLAGRMTRSDGPQWAWSRDVICAATSR